MDEISLKILKILQKKARIPNAEVARQVGLVPSAVLERIRKLEKQGIIDGYEVRLNPVRFKRDLVAFVHVFVEKESENQNVAKILTEFSEIQEVHYIAGNDCYLVKIRVADTNELEKVIRKKILTLNNVKSTKTDIAMSTYKETWQIPLNESDIK